MRGVEIYALTNDKNREPSGVGVVFKIVTLSALSRSGNINGSLRGTYLDDAYEK